MERVAFLLEEDGTRIACLLNPASLLVRRTAGLERRASASGGLGGSGAAGDPWIATGGGTTEVLVDLFFDTSIVRGTTIESRDVRDWTQPLWRLSENSAERHGRRQPPVVRFLWGLAWNLPVVVAAIAERLEEFDAGGVPQRSYMRMRLLRVDDQPPLAADAADDPRAIPSPSSPAPGGTLGAVEVMGVPAGSSVPLFQLAQDAYGDPSLWRWIALANGIDDPLHVAPGTVLDLPVLPSPEGSP